MKKVEINNVLPLLQQHNVVGSASCPPMSEQTKKEISKISQSFARGFKKMFCSCNGTGWLLVDPLSAYLNSIGFENTLHQLPESDKHPQVLIMTFKDCSQFIPAGGDLKLLHKDFKNWMWL